MYNMDEQEATSFRLPPELKRRLKLACADRDVKQTEAVIAGLEWWLGSKYAPTSPKSGRIDAKVKRKLIQRLRIAIESIESAIDDMGDEQPKHT
jgi:hypothetical protein